MKYLFTSIIGSLVLEETFQNEQIKNEKLKNKEWKNDNAKEPKNEGLKIIDTLPFQNLEDYQQKQAVEKKCYQKYPDLKPLPLPKIPIVLGLLKDQKYHSLFYQQNLALTKQLVKESISDDQLIMQAIANIAELDKVCNLLSKRLREWYGLYAPEVSEEISSHERFIAAIVSKSKTQLLIEMNLSDGMGADLGNVHVEEILLLAEQLIQLYALRQKHEDYLQNVMKTYCPNILELGGTTIGAKLIELGRGLKHLALLPASTIQLLGAEKALFRHITTGSKSPKYGLLYQHPLIQKAPSKNKGKAARMLADKLSLCARLDYFKGEFKANEYRKELEEKLNEDKKGMKKKAERFS